MVFAFNVHWHGTLLNLVALCKSYTRYDYIETFQVWVRHTTLSVAD